MKVYKNEVRYPYSDPLKLSEIVIEVPNYNYIFKHHLFTRTLMTKYLKLLFMIYAISVFKIQLKHSLFTCFTVQMFSEEPSGTHRAPLPTTDPSGQSVSFIADIPGLRHIHTVLQSSLITILQAFLLLQFGDPLINEKKLRKNTKIILRESILIFLFTSASAPIDFFLEWKTYCLSFWKHVRRKFETTCVTFGVT